MGRKFEVDEDFLIFAFRYALGRKTYAVSDVANYLNENWNKLSLMTKVLIKKEVKDAIENDFAGDPQVDVPYWQRLLDL